MNARKAPLAALLLPLAMASAGCFSFLAARFLDTLPLTVRACTREIAT